MKTNKEISTAIFIIGENVKRERLRIGLSQEQLAFKSNITHGTISKLERHDMDNISLKTIVSLAMAMGVATVTLLYDKDDYL